MTFETTEEVYCLSYFHVKQEYREELINALLSLIEPTRKEVGCLQYELLLDHENPNFLIMLEKFSNNQALIDHEKQPYIKNFVDTQMNKYCENVAWNVASEAIKTK